MFEEGISSSNKRNSWIKKCTCSPCTSYLLFLGVIWKNEIACVGLARSEFLSEMKCEVENAETKVGLYLFNITTNEFRMFAIDLTVS